MHSSGCYIVSGLILCFVIRIGIFLYGTHGLKGEAKAIGRPAHLFMSNHASDKVGSRFLCELL